MNPLRRARLLFSLASGIFLAFGLQPYDAPIVPWISIAALMISVFGARPWVAALGGWLHGMAFYLISVPWIFGVMRTYGNLTPAQAGGVLVLMCSILALFPAAFAWGVNRLHHAAGAERACLAAPFLWVAAEFGRTHMPDVAFPWNFLGYSVSNHLALLQLASLGGIYLVSFAAAGYNALFAYFLFTRTRRAWAAWLVTTGVLMPLMVIGHRFVPSPPVPSRVAHLVQPNLPQATTFDASWSVRHEAAIAEIESLTVTAAQARRGLIVWPEVPAPFTMRDANFVARAARIAQESQSHFLLGVVGWKPATAATASPGTPANGWDGPYNSAVLLDPSGKPVFTYDKIHLVPFGEYVPWGLATLFRQLTAEVSGFRPGTEYKTGELPDEPGPAEMRTPGAPRRFGIFICYEAIFPNEVRRFTAAGAEVLINTSNDAWFGRSGAPAQHLVMARVRAVENRRWLLRATNNGFTAAVDPYGRIVVQLEPDRRGVLAAPYDFRNDRTLYSLAGDWVPWLSLAATLYFWFGWVRRPKVETKAAGAMRS